jgi:hypothetical protein
MPIERLGFFLAAAVAPLIVGVAPSRAAVVVIANRAPHAVRLDTVIDDDAPQPLMLEPGDSRPLFASKSARVRVGQGDDRQEIKLQPDSAYFVGVRPKDGSLGLRKIGLGEGGPRSWKPPATPPFELPDAGVITVKILVDDDEYRNRRTWEPAIRQRLDRASVALDEHCGIRLRVVAVDTWDSDDGERNFQRSLAEFEREAVPAPAMVAIGFSSQYQIARGRVHLGGTRGPLHSHILVKERSNSVLEPERLELLVHELGHFLGATHSPEATSVMRPVIGQGLQRAAGARVQFDPPNTLLMSLLAQEIRQRRVRQLSDISPETRRRMGEIYRAVNPTLPNDPAAGHYVELMAAAGARPLIDDTRTVLLAVVRAAQLRQSMSERQGAAGGKAASITNDQMLELYVRQAALAAKQVRPENAQRALLLALGVAFDDVGLLRKLPIAGAVIPHIEGEQERAQRMAAIGQPTMRGRADWAKHFFVSAHLVALAGSETARSAGLVKEMVDAHGGSGFSFADMAANRAGIVFAHALLSNRLTLDDIVQRFSVEAFLPPIDDLREQLGAQEFYKDYGGLTDERLAAELSRIEARITALPIYQSRPAPAR